MFSNIGESLFTVETQKKNYIQMRLPSNKITPEYENAICSKINLHGLKLEIRESTSDDIPIIINLYEESWHSVDLPVYHLTKETLKEILEDPDIVCIVVRENKVDCGFVLLDFEGPDKKIGKIAGLGILPEYQNQGIGTYLAMTAWSYFKKRGIDEIRVEVHKENTNSYKFIKAFGFEEFHNREYISPLK